MTSSSSSIRVFIRWSEHSVFAGEDVNCEITFKNVASLQDPNRGLVQNGRIHAPVSSDRIRKHPPLTSAASNLRRSVSTRPAAPDRGHRSTLSLNLATTDGRSERGIDSWKDSHSKAGTESGAHRKSVSIISLGQSESALDDSKSHASFAPGSRRPSKTHGRAASLQIVPRRNNLSIGSTGPPSGKFMP